MIDDGDVPATGQRTEDLARAYRLEPARHEREGRLEQASEKRRGVRSALEQLVTDLLEHGVGRVPHRPDRRGERDAQHRLERIALERLGVDIELAQEPFPGDARVSGEPLPVVADAETGQRVGTAEGRVGLRGAGRGDEGD